MLNSPINHKLIGSFLLISTVFILIGAVVAAIILPSFGLASGVSFIQLIPFYLLMTFLFVFSGICLYIAIRYFKRKPFKENKPLGLIFVISGSGYFIISTMSCIISNLTGNTGGYARPVFALLILLIFVPLGLGLKNGYK